MPDTESALAGAQDIIAETVSDDAALRKDLRTVLLRDGVITTAAAKDEESVYRMYYDYEAPCPAWPPTGCWPSTGASGRDT